MEGGIKRYLAMKLDYGEGDFGFDVNGHQLVHLMFIGNRGSPKLRAWLTMGLSFALFELGFGLPLHRRKWRRPPWPRR